ncbi:MAG: Gfo/Idh/MocA family oxidoreductase, partial [Alphaproteobacteria bacterium]|nr:Gfo/Idh/MocA family oxidoreductase [Alphaproteobacteria bacterium]
MQANAGIKLGLVGTGAWGMKSLAAADEASGVTLAHIASPHVATKTLPDSVTGHTDWRDLLGPLDLDMGLDGLIIATPPETHWEIARAALEAGLAILVEKPVTLTPSDAEDLLELAKSKSAIVHVGHIDLQNPALVAVMAERPQQSDIQRISGNWSNAGPWRDDATPLWDWGPHPLACCLAVAGLANIELDVSVDIVGEGKMFVVQGNVNGIEVDLRFGNGGDRRRRWMEIASTGQVLRYDDDVDAKATRDGKPLTYANTPALTAQTERFAQAIRLGNPDTSD